MKQFLISDQKKTLSALRQIRIQSLASEHLILKSLDNLESKITSAGIIKPGTHKWVCHLAQKIASQIIPQNPSGFTFDPLLDKCLALGRNTNSEIYVVSINGHEQRLPRIPTELDLSRWIAGQLQLLLRLGNFIGGWPYLGEYFLDVSVLVRGRSNAESFAQANEQFNIYHPATDQCLSVQTGVVSTPTPSRL